MDIRRIIYHAAVAVALLLPPIKAELDADPATNADWEVTIPTLAMVLGTGEAARRGGTRKKMGKPGGTP